MKIEECGFEKIDVAEMQCNPFQKIAKEWFLLTAGNMADWNTMTCSWGFTGEMWGKDCLMSVVRTNRHTIGYMDKNDLFTVCFFDPGYRPALSYCGSHSGRDVDKARETGLVPMEVDGTVAFEQAREVLVVRKMYTAMMDENGFTDTEAKDKWYGTDPMHRQFIGEVLAYYRRK